MTCLGLGRFGKKPRIVFLVDVYIAHPESFELVATKVPLREPVYYDEKSMMSALRTQHSKLYKNKLVGKGWLVEVVEWFNKK